MLITLDPVCQLFHAPLLIPVLPNLQQLEHLIKLGYPWVCERKRLFQMRGQLF